MISIKDNYKFSMDPTMEDLIKRTNNWIYKTKKSNLDCPSGPVTQRIEALSLHGYCGLKKARGEIWPKPSEEETTQNYQDEDKKSAINKKLILRLRSLISK